MCPACLLTAAFADSATVEVGEDDAVDGLPPGTTFGSFLIRRPLGRGGMAAVYEALDRRLERAVALKVLPAEFLNDRTFGRRFETEGRLIARLEHPNIVPIYASGIEAGIPWMSMRLLTGNNLSVLLEQRRLAPSEIVQLLRQVATALDYAHGLGVVHRDIKPANILLDGSGIACVADFGLAQMIHSSNRLTQTGILTGTPHYMAPEQALGQRVDHRCDIYSLGIVAYEMLAGATPFTAESPVAVLLQHIHEPLPAPPVGASASCWMDAIRKAAAKNPADRWASAGAFVDALESSIDGAPAPAGKTTRLPELFVPWRRIAAAGGVVVAVAATVWVTGHQPRSLSPEALSSAPVPRKEKVAPPARPAPTPLPDNAGGATGASGTRSSRASTAAPRRAAPLASQESRPPQPSEDLSAAGSAPPPNQQSTPLVVESPLIMEPLTRMPGVPAPPPVADVVTEPEVVRKVTAVYPAAATAAELEGDVLLAGVVGIDGKVSNITVERSAHPLLDAAARKAWLQFQYKPARRNGIPEPARVRQPFKFLLGSH
jgi:TonB family protein